MTQQRMSLKTVYYISVAGLGLAGERREGCKPLRSPDSKNWHLLGKRL